MRRLQCPADNPYFASGKGSSRSDGLNVRIAIHIFPAQQRLRDSHGVSGLSRHKVSPRVQQDQRIESCSNIIHHDTCSRGQSLQAAQREGLHDVEATEKYKTREKVFPIEGNGDQRDHLAGDFVNHYEPRVVSSALARDHRRRRDANDRDGQRHQNRGEREPARIDHSRTRPPQEHGDGSGPRPGSRLQMANAEKRRNQPAKSGLGESGGLDGGFHSEIVGVIPNSVSPAEENAGSSTSLGMTTSNPISFCWKYGGKFFGIRSTNCTVFAMKKLHHPPPSCCTALPPDSRSPLDR